MKKIKKSILYSFFLLALSFFTTNKSQAQVISSHFFGQNAWMPDTIGNGNNCQDAPCIFNGKLHKQWGSIGASGAQFMRFGGIAADRNMPTDYQYLKMIDSSRAHGMEPIIQVPFRNNRFNAQQAAAIVQFINVTSHRNVKYWSIGNEPDLGYSYTTAAQVAAYTKAFASAMKAVDPTILIIGPETAWFDQNIINGLTTPGGADDITGKDGNGHYYIDVISFHTYPFNGSQTRAQVISKLTASGSLQDNLVYLNGRITTCNNAHGRTGTAALKTAITEMNVDWQNDSGDNLYGVGANSFIGGQFWAEMMGIAMKNGVDFVNFWSVVEGGNATQSIGYIDPSTGNKKPTYYHFQMMAQNFRGNVINATGNQANVKAFASQSNQQIAVMIMNQELTANYNVTVKLGTGTVSGNNPLKINVSAGLSTEYNDVVPSQGTILLVFNNNGTLIKKYEYTLNAHAVSNLPPTMTQYGTTAVEPVSNADEGPDFEIAKVYPNPTDAKFTVQLNQQNNAGRKFQVEIFDIEGRLVLTKTDATFTKGKEEVNLLYSAMASGVYIARIKFDDNHMKTTKIVLAK